MGYVFSEQEQGTFKFTMSNSNSLTLNGVNATETDANVIVRGIMAMLSIGGVSHLYNPTTGYRTVKQNVYDD